MLLLLLLLPNRNLNMLAIASNKSILIQRDFSSKDSTRESRTLPHNLNYNLLD